MVPSPGKEALLSPETAASPVSVASISSDDFFDAPDHFVSEEDSLAEKVRIEGLQGLLFQLLKR